MAKLATTKCQLCRALVSTDCNFIVPPSCSGHSIEGDYCIISNNSWNLLSIWINVHGEIFMQQNRALNLGRSQIVTFLEKHMILQFCHVKYYFQCKDQWSCSNLDSKSCELRALSKIACNFVSSYMVGLIKLAIYCINSIPNCPPNAKERSINWPILNAFI